MTKKIFNFAVAFSLQGYISPNHPTGFYMKNVKNIIFDLGGVVIDLDRSMAIKALQDLGVTQAGTLLGKYEQKGPFLKLETGELTSSELFDTLLPLCRPGTTATEIRDAFEKFLVDLPVQRLATIRELRARGFKVFVLSNTNPIMYNHWIENKFRQEGKTVNDYFDGIVASFQERACKPDPQIFKNLIERYNLVPEETVLLDDSEANCKSAQTLGLNAVQVMKTGENSFSAICNRLLEKGPAE